MSNRVTPPPAASALTASPPHPPSVLVSSTRTPPPPAIASTLLNSTIYNTVTPPSPPPRGSVSNDHGGEGPRHNRPCEKKGNHDYHHRRCDENDDAGGDLVNTSELKREGVEGWCDGYDEGYREGAMMMKKVRGGGGRGGGHAVTTATEVRSSVGSGNDCGLTLPSSLPLPSASLGCYYQQRGAPPPPPPSVSATSATSSSRPLHSNPPPPPSSYSVQFCPAAALFSSAASVSSAAMSGHNAASPSVQSRGHQHHHHRQQHPPPPLHLERFNKASSPQPSFHSSNHNNSYYSCVSRGSSGSGLPFQQQNQYDENAISQQPIAAAPNSRHYSYLRPPPPPPTNPLSSFSSSSRCSSPLTTPALRQQTEAMLCASSPPLYHSHQQQRQHHHRQCLNNNDNDRDSSKPPTTVTHNAVLTSSAATRRAQPCGGISSLQHHHHHHNHFSNHRSPSQASSTARNNAGEYYDDDDDDGRSERDDLMEEDGDDDGYGENRRGREEDAIVDADVPIFDVEPVGEDDPILIDPAYSSNTLSFMLSEGGAMLRGDDAFAPRLCGQKLFVRDRKKNCHQHHQSNTNTSCMSCNYDEDIVPVGWEELGGGGGGGHSSCVNGTLFCCDLTQRQQHQQQQEGRNNSDGDAALSSNTITMAAMDSKVCLCLPPEGRFGHAAVAMGDQKKRSSSSSSQQRKKSRGGGDCGGGCAASDDVQPSTPPPLQNSGCCDAVYTTTNTTNTDAIGPSLLAAASTLPSSSLSKSPVKVSSPSPSPSSSSMMIMFGGRGVSKRLGDTWAFRLVADGSGGGSGGGGAVDGSSHHQQRDNACGCRCCDNNGDKQQQQHGGVWMLLDRGVTTIPFSPAEGVTVEERGIATVSVGNADNASPSSALLVPPPPPPPPPPPSSPLPRCGHAMAATLRGTVFMFSGSTSDVHACANDFWELDVKAMEAMKGGGGGGCEEGDAVSRVNCPTVPYLSSTPYTAKWRLRGGNPYNEVIYTTSSASSTSPPIICRRVVAAEEQQQQGEYPIGRKGHTLTLVGKCHLVMIGGCDPLTHTSYHQSRPLSSSSLSEGRRELEAEEEQKAIANNAFTRVVWTYNIDTSKWRSFVPIGVPPRARTYHVAAVSPATVAGIHNTSRKSLFILGGASVVDETVSFRVASSPHHHQTYFSDVFELVFRCDGTPQGRGPPMWVRIDTSPSPLSSSVVGHLGSMHNATNLSPVAAVDEATDPTIQPSTRLLQPSSAFASPSPSSLPSSSCASGPSPRMCSAAVVKGNRLLLLFGGGGVEEGLARGVDAQWELNLNTFCWRAVGGEGTVAAMGNGYGGNDDDDDAAEIGEGRNRRRRRGGRGGGSGFAGRNIYDDGSRGGGDNSGGSSTNRHNRIEGHPPCNRPTVVVLEGNTLVSFGGAVVEGRQRQRQQSQRQQRSARRGDESSNTNGIALLTAVATPLSPPQPSQADLQRMLLRPPTATATPLAASAQQQQQQAVPTAAPIVVPAAPCCFSNRVYVLSLQPLSLSDACREWLRQRATRWGGEEKGEERAAAEKKRRDQHAANQHGHSNSHSRAVTPLRSPPVVLNTSLLAETAAARCLLLSSPREQHGVRCEKGGGGEGRGTHQRGRRTVAPHNAAVAAPSIPQHLARYLSRDEGEGGRHEGVDEM